MKLQEVINSFNEISIKQPNINQYIKSGNIYDLSQDRNAKFGVFCVTQASHEYDIENALMNYTFYLYYVDRLKSDDSNKIEIQSTGINTINNIVRTFREKYDVDISNITYDTFVERFSESCAGVWGTVTVSVYDEGCLDLF